MRLRKSHSHKAFRKNQLTTQHSGKGRLSKNSSLLNWEGNRMLLVYIVRQYAPGKMFMNSTVKRFDIQWPIQDSLELSFLIYEILDIEGINWRYWKQ